MAIKAVKRVEYSFQHGGEAENETVSGFQVDKLRREKSAIPAQAFKLLPSNFSLTC